MITGVYELMAADRRSAFGELRQAGSGTLIDEIAIVGGPEPHAEPEKTVEGDAGVTSSVLNVRARGLQGSLVQCQHSTGLSARARPDVVLSRRWSRTE